MRKMRFWAKADKNKKCGHELSKYPFTVMNTDLPPITNDHYWKIASIRDIIILLERVVIFTRKFRQVVKNDRFSAFR